MALTEKLRFRCEPSLKKRMAKIAKANKRTLSNWVILVLERESARELRRLEPPTSGASAKSSQPGPDKN